MKVAVGPKAMPSRTKSARAWKASSVTDDIDEVQCAYEWRDRRDRLDQAIAWYELQSYAWELVRISSIMVGTAHPFWFQKVPASMTHHFVTYTEEGPEKIRLEERRVSQKRHSPGWLSYALISRFVNSLFTDTIKAELSSPLCLS